MLSRLILASLFLLASLSPAAAQERAFLGWSRLFTNDALGDGQDRWHTGASSLSVLWGPVGLTGAPENPGDLIEFRFATEILAPANLLTPAAGDRRYAGTLSLGAFSHFARAGYEVSAGAELVAVGPMTRLDRFHSAFHGAIGMSAPGAAVRAGQIGDALYPSAQIELARPIALGGGVRIRPFVEARGGDETFGRFGADLLFGPNFNSGLLLRDGATGMLYQGLGKQAESGLSFLLGADTTHVFNSAWLPATGGYRLMPLTSRVRAGVQWQGEHVGVFYGATWLGRDFVAQPEGQLVGSLQLRVRF